MDIHSVHIHVYMHIVVCTDVCGDAYTALDTSLQQKRGFGLVRTCLGETWRYSS